MRPDEVLLFSAFSAAVAGQKACYITVSPSKAFWARRIVASWAEEFQLPTKNGLPKNLKISANPERLRGEKWNLCVVDEDAPIETKTSAQALTFRSK